MTTTIETSGVHVAIDAQTSCAPGPNFPGDHEMSGTQTIAVTGDQAAEITHGSAEPHPSPVDLGSNSPSGHMWFDTQDTTAEGNAETDHQLVDNHGFNVGLGPILMDPTLGLTAEVVSDLESVRNANQNRLRTLTTPVDKGGFGLGMLNPDVVRLKELVDGLEASYDQSVKNLQKVMKAHPLGAWCKKTTGVGEKQLARLLATIGDPYWNNSTDAPRTVAQLWKYSGYDVSEGVAPKRKKGHKTTWSPDARMRTFLIAESCVKVKTSPYRKVYDQAREKYAEALHAYPCAQCGIKGKPAIPGTPLRPGHQHARALRAISKEVLKDLWIESRRIHHEQVDEATSGFEGQLRHASSTP